MKILVIAPTPFFSDRGCHVRILEESRALQERGYIIKIVTYHLGDTPDELDVDRIGRIPWYKKRSAGPSWHKFYLDLFLFMKCVRVNKGFKADIIHAHLHEGCFIGYFIKKFFHTPLVFDYQGSMSKEIVAHDFVKRKGVFISLFKVVEKQINHMADSIVVSAASLKQDLIKKNIAEKNITVIPDGISSTVFATVKERSKPVDISLPQNKKIIVYLGHFSEYQGMDLLLDSISILKQDRDDFHFLLMGYPNEKYKVLAQKKNIKDQLTFTGKITYDRMYDYLRLGDIAVSPKLIEHEGNGKLLNYMAVKLPIIVFKNPINESILGKDGIYVDKKDAKMFALSISETLDSLDDPSFIIGERGYRRLVDKFQWIKLVKKLESVFNGLN